METKAKMSLEEGLLIRKARKASGYTQLELCDKLEMSHAPINQVEARLPLPSVDLLGVRGLARLGVASPLGALTIRK